LAEAGTRRRHACLPSHRRRVAPVGEQAGRRPRQASLGGAQPGRRARPHARRMDPGEAARVVSGAQIELQHKLHVLTKKEELDGVRVQGKVVVVLDILFATTTMVAALANGAREIVPVLDEAAARACGAGIADCVLAGELYAETLPGFAHPAPLALIEHGVRGKTVVYSTTTGT